MGKRKGKRSQNQQNQSINSPGPNSMLKNAGEEVVVELNSKEISGNLLNFQSNEPPKHAYKTVFMSNENVTSAEKSGNSEIHKSRESVGRGSNVEKVSSYQSLIDGGAYDQFRTSQQNVSRGNVSTASKYDFESAGDRVLAGSRSISHRSLFSDDKSLNTSGFPKPLRTSSRNSRFGSGMQWEDFDNHDELDDGGVRISRGPSAISIQSAGVPQPPPRSSTSRARTVSSSSERPQSSARFVEIPSNISTSQKHLGGGGHDEEDHVRTFHADSQCLQNRLSKLSIHSNNDEFVLVGGHPPAFSATSIDNISRRSRQSFGGGGNHSSRGSSFADDIGKEMPTTDRESFKKFTFNEYSSRDEDEDVGRSISQQSLSQHHLNTQGHVSRSSSRHTVGTTSNTDDRLMLAARYSKSPEAEGLLEIPKSSENTLTRSRSRSSTISEKVGFVEIPTLHSHPDDRFDGEEHEGEPFRPTSEHSFTPTASANTRPSLRRSSSSSSSIISRLLEQREKQPESALLVTSALTPVASKRNVISLSRSDDSIQLETPQTVQRAADVKRIRPVAPLTEQIEQKENKQVEISIPPRRKTMEIAVQTGDSIRLRQNQVDALSAHAYLPAPSQIELSTTKTESFIPTNLASHENLSSNPSTVVVIPKNSDTANANSLRSRLRHISDVYNTNNNEGSGGGGGMSSDDVEYEARTTSQRTSTGTLFSWESNKTRATAIEPPTRASSGSFKALDIIIPKNAEKRGDTIRKHVPRGRIRDLAETFNRLSVGSPAPIPNPKSVFQTDGYEPNISYKLSNVPSIKNIRPHGHSSSSRLDGSTSSALRSSTNTIPDERRRSTSSSLHLQPNVFTRNTFLYGSRTIEKPAPVAQEYEKKTPNTSSISTKEFAEVPIRLEVPIAGLPQRNEKERKKRQSQMNRAKTQEVPSAIQFESRFESRAFSGDLPTENGVFGMQKPLYAASREVFGRDTAEDLTGKQQESWSPIRLHHQPSWESSTRGGSGSQNNVKTITTTSPTYITHHTTTTTDHHHRHYEINPSNTIERGDFITPSSKLTKTIETPILDAHQHHPHHLSHHHQHQPIMTTTSRHHPYSPPATEDAGSRITHHTTSTLQDDMFAGTGTEDSSIRGKIDRMFDFVESDDSRKTHRAPSFLGSQASTDTIGISAQRHHPFQETSIYKKSRFAEEKPEQSPMSSRIKSPDRRNTVTGSETHNSQQGDSELEYSLAQYREMQREQLRRRLPSADEPQFFKSPLLSAPHAGQSMHAYRTKDFLGAPTAGEKVRLPSSSSFVKSPPPALATSTPIDSPLGRSSISTKERYSPMKFHHHNENTTTMTNSQMMPPNDTFVSSISGVSAVDKHAEALRKINRLTYMIENTQKQMSMNEAALLDAQKKGRRQQEIAAHRSILITRETLRLQRTELRRLHAFSAVRRPPPPIAKELKGSVVFKNIVVHLNKLFVSRLSSKDDNSYSFVGLFKYGHQVEATELVPLRVFPGEETSDKLIFEKQIQFSDVPIDFMATIEIYAMRVTPSKPVELSIGTSFANKCKSLMGPPQKKSSTPSTETAFKFRGRLVLDRDAAGDRTFYLDDVTYPLEGTVTITTECSRLPEAFEVDFRGFLTMFHTISNMASWERYWAVLRRGVVFFWQYPDDEQMGREPKMLIDLTKCTNNTIEKCGFDLCPRANSFAIEILVDTEDVGTIGSVVEKKRVLLSCDTSEMLNQWLFTLNQTLDVIRGPI